MLVRADPKILAEIIEPPSAVINTLWDSIKKATVPYNKNLIGQIEKELVLDVHETVRQYFNGIVISSKLAEDRLKKVSDLWRTIDNKKNLPNIYLGDMWVNFQKKHEYNPPHTHSGLFSFVIFLQIPFKDEDEIKMSNSINSRKSLNGNFCLLDLNEDIYDYNYTVDKSWEGKGFFFSSDRIHTVYPFYSSNEERITVSGNIYFK
jgi:hypothetical protein